MALDDTTSTNSSWHGRPLQSVRDAARLLGLSTTTLYKMARCGDLKLKRLAGRTMIETSEIVRIIDSANDWTPSRRTENATAARWADRTRSVR